MGTVSRVYCAVVIAALIFGVQARWRHRVDCRECHQRCQEFEFRCPHACFVCFPRNRDPVTPLPTATTPPARPTTDAPRPPASPPPAAFITLQPVKSASTLSSSTSNKPALPPMSLVALAALSAIVVV